MELIRIFTEATSHFAALLDDERTAKNWDEPSACQGLTVGGLVAHVVQGSVWTERLLDAPAPVDAPVATLGQAMAGFKMTTPEDFDSDLHTYLRDLAERGATVGPDQTRANWRAVAARLAEKFGIHPMDRLLDTRPTVPFAFRLDDRVRALVVDVVVHSDDLAVSIGRDDVSLPAEAVTVAVDALIAGARARHGDVAVVRALARRERSSVSVFPVL